MKMKMMKMRMMKMRMKMMTVKMMTMKMRTRMREDHFCWSIPVRLHQRIPSSKHLVEQQLTSSCIQGIDFFVCFLPFCLQFPTASLETSSLASSVSNFAFLYFALVHPPSAFIYFYG